MKTPTKAKEDRIARSWEDFFAVEPGVFASSTREILRATRSPLIRFVHRHCHLGEKADVLEAGCGGGQFGLALATSGIRTVELDFSPLMLQKVRSAIVGLVATGHRVASEPLRGDLTHLPMPDGRVDLVLSEGVVEHWVARDERIRILNEMTRVTRNGGCVVVCIPNNRHPLYGWWYFLQRLLRSGWLVYRPGGSLEEARIGPAELKGELESAGLSEVVIDGFAVTRTIAHYPRWLPLRALAKLLETVLPEFPRGIRSKWGIYLMAAGRKKG